MSRDDSPKFTVIDWSDIAIPYAPQWLIPNLIERETFNVVFGKPGQGKTFFVLDMALNLASGNPWFGRCLKRAGVVYIAAEGFGGLTRRIAAWRDAHSLDVDSNVAFAVINAAPDIINDAGAICDAIRKATMHWDVPVGLIVIDTLSRTFGGGDENGSDMASYVTASGRIQRDLQCAVIVVHHQPKEAQNKTPRGHGALAGAADTMLYVHKAGDLFTAETVKSKDTPGDGVQRFKLRSIELIDADEQIYTSCVIEPSDYEAPVAKPRLSRQQQIALAELRKLIADTGSHTLDASAAGVPLMVNAVKLEDWRAKCDAAALSDGAADAKRMAFKRVRESLQALNIIGVSDPFVWITP